MKRKFLISSFLLICLSLCLIVGSTFALFTSEASVNIAVTSGKVNVNASILDNSLQLYSMGNKCEGLVFENGGSVYYDKDNASLTLDNVTPGDKLDFTIQLFNESNIDIKYRIKWTGEGELIDGLTANCEDEKIINSTSNWYLWETRTEKVKELKISIELPVNANNLYQEKNANFTFIVEAVQKNAADLVNASFVSTEEELITFIEKGGLVYLTKSLNLESKIDVTKDTTILSNPNSVLSFSNDGSINVLENSTLLLEGVTIDNNESFGFNEDGKLEFENIDNRKNVPLFNVNCGKIVLSEGTIIKNVTSKESAVIKATGTLEKRAEVVLKGATIDSCAGKSGTVVNLTSNSDCYIEEGTVISNNLSYDCSNHGIIKVYSMSKLYINGGEIVNNTYSGNGLIGLWNKGECEMNAGKIYNNSYCKRENTWIDNESTANSRYNLIYVHNSSLFTMNGGEIVENDVAHIRCGVIDAVNGYQVYPNIVINKGVIKNNYALESLLKTEVFASLYDENHLVLGNEAEVSGTIYYYLNSEIEYKNVNVELEEDFINISQNDSLQKLELNNVNIKANNVITSSKPVELWLVDSSFNCKNAVILNENSINTTVVISNCSFNLDSNFKVIDVESNSNLPVVVYLLGEIKVNDVVLTKENYKEYFGNDITVIFS